jgi:hypothetical protein
LADDVTPSEIWTIDGDSRTRVNLMHDAQAHDTMPDWQPWHVQNGSLAFIDEDGERSIAFADADGKHFHNSFNGFDDVIQDMDYSPNGTLISIVRNGSLEFYDSLGESAGFLLGYPIDPAAAAWFPDSQHMVVATTAREMYDVSPSDHGTNLTNTAVYEIAVSPDGLRIRS